MRVAGLEILRLTVKYIGISMKISHSDKLQCLIRTNSSSHQTGDSEKISFGSSMIISPLLITGKLEWKCNRDLTDDSDNLQIKVKILTDYEYMYTVINYFY